MVRGGLAGGFLAGSTHGHQIVDQGTPESRRTPRGPQLLQGAGERVLEVQLEEPQLPVGDALAVVKTHLVQRRLEQMFETFLGRGEVAGADSQTADQGAQGRSQLHAHRVGSKGRPRHSGQVGNIYI
jgi:hypothetical protein